MCVAYEVDGKQIKYFPHEVRKFDRVTPVYETFKGWKKPTSGARKLSELPPEAITYINAMEKSIGAKIALVSVGPKREETIEI